MALLVTEAATARADTFPLLGTGSEPLRSGVLGSNADINNQPIALAARSDGVIAFASEHRVFWVQNGRLLRLRVPLRGFPSINLAFAADGTLLVGSCPDLEPGTAAVFRVSPGVPARVVAGIPGRRGTSGDGGPATAARLRCAAGVSAERDGSILIADSAARRVRRVDAQGVIRTVAGTGGRTIAGDGGPATAASLGYPESVAALPDGGFAIASPDLRGGPPGERGTPPAIRIVDANGIITMRARVSATRMTAEPDGSLLLADWTRRDGLVRRLRTDGSVSLAADVASDRVGIPEFPRVLGDPFRSDDDIQTDAAVSTHDGGLLVAADFGIFYVAPAAPKLLALALRSETRRVRRDLLAGVRVTRPARVTVEAWRGGRRVAGVTADVAAGDSTLSLGVLPAGAYDVRAVAEDEGQLVATHAIVLAGGRLTKSYARQFIVDELSLVETFFGGALQLGRCRRSGATRVICVLRKRHRCAGTASLRLRRDGSLAIRAHRGGCGRR